MNSIDDPLGGIGKRNAPASHGPRQWSFHNPVRESFGDGVSDSIGEVLDGRRYMLVTYGEPSFREMAMRIIAEAGEPFQVIDDVSANPDFASLAESCALLGSQDALPRGHRRPRRRIGHRHSQGTGGFRREL